MFGFGKSGRQRYIDGLIDAAQSWQFGFYDLIKDNRTAIICDDADLAHKIAAGLVNWIFRFGDCGPNEQLIPSFRSEVEKALPRISKILTDDYKVELTAAVITSAAAQNIPIELFKSHFERLHRLNLVMRGINIYEIDRKLRAEHKSYYHHMQYGHLDQRVTDGDSRPSFGDNEKSTLIDALAGMLAVQKAAAGSNSIEDESGQINRKAIGYIYGFVDSALSTLGQDMSDAAVSVPIIYQVMRRLFPGCEEIYTAFLAAHMGKDEAVTLGALKGGQQYIDFVAKRRDDGGVAMGLARYLIEAEINEEEMR